MNLRWHKLGIVTLISLCVIGVTSCDLFSWEKKAKPVTIYRADTFGGSVAISGDTVAIGAENDGDRGSSAGTVYVYTLDNKGAWMRQVKLYASDAAPNDNFGFQVALSGNTMLIGTRKESAYVFMRDSTGTWKQQAKFSDPDISAHDYFGWSVAISGETAVVGAWWNNGGNGVRSGSVYVYTPDSKGIWKQQAKLIANDGATEEWFGYSVSISGDTIAVGAMGDRDHHVASGSAYIFSRGHEGIWKQQAKLLANDRLDWDSFGSSIAVSGDTLVVGAKGMTDGYFTEKPGSAYVYTRDSSGYWKQQAKIQALDGVTNDSFGWSLSLSDNTVVIGSLRDKRYTDGTGSAYVFTRDSAGTWSQYAKLMVRDNIIYRFGWSVAVFGTTTVVGAPTFDEVAYGRAYIFAPNRPVIELKSKP